MVSGQNHSVKFRQNLTGNDNLCTYAEFPQGEQFNNFPSALKYFYMQLRLQYNNKGKFSLMGITQLALTGNLQVSLLK